MYDVKAIVTVICITIIALAAILTHDFSAKDITISAVSGLVGFLAHGAVYKTKSTNKDTDLKS